MRSRQSLVSALLALAMLAGTVLASAHDSDHGLQPGAAHGCVVCVYAHGAGHGALPATPVVALGAFTESPEFVFTAAQTAATVRIHPIRGPPALLS